MPEKIEITFLGTSSAPPQKERRQSSIALKYKEMTYLVDFGEGTQIQMIKNQIGFKNIIVLLTHLHSDHCLGLVGYLATRNFFNIKTPITIIGPPWTTSFLFLQFLAFRFYPDYEIKVLETEGGIVYLDKNLYIQSFQVNHSIESLGYKFVTHQKLGKFNSSKAEELNIPKGKLWKQLQKGIPVSLKGKRIYPSEVLEEVDERTAKIVITGDTAVDQNVINHAAYADLLIHDSTYPAKEEKRALKYKHSTCKQAAFVAKSAKVKKLVLTHFSELHEDLHHSLKEARKIFPHTFLAEDGLKIEVNF